MVNRQIAYKAWICDLTAGIFHRETNEFEPNYLLVRDKKIFRVNIIAHVVDAHISSDFDYGNIELDDGFGRIMVRAWKDDVELLKNIEVGSLVLFIGKVKEFNGRIYLIPEIVKELKNLSWARLRRLELKKLYGEPTQSENVMNVDENKTQILPDVITNNTKQKILWIINSMDEISYDELIVKSGLVEEEVEKVVNELIKEGEIYTPRPNYLRGI